MYLLNIIIIIFILASLVMFHKLMIIWTTYKIKKSCEKEILEFDTCWKTIRERKTK